jgi:chromosome segregation ATPase
MKNYIITSNELDIVNRRLFRLYARKQKLNEEITNCNSHLKEIVTSGGVVSDKMTNYVAELEEVDNEILELENQAKELKTDLDYMDSRLSNINEIKEQVFVMYFIRGLKPLQIAPKIPCGKSSVYRYIDEINKERASWEKIRKI